MTTRLIPRLVLATVLFAGATSATFAIDPGDLRGTWYLSADASQPTSIGVVNSGSGPALVFTNEKGDAVQGQMTGRDDLVVGWNGPRGNLKGHIRGDPTRNGVIDWDNGSSWTRVPDRPAGWDGRFNGVRDDLHYPDRRRPDYRDHDHGVYRPWR